MSQGTTRNRRTERNRPLYEGNGETVRTTTRNVRGEKQPIGVSPELRERQERYRQQTARMAVYDDLDQRGEARPVRRRQKSYSGRRRDRHTGLWLLVICLCWLCIGSLALFIAPQLLGVHFASMPNYAFVGGSIIQFDRADYEHYLELRRSMSSDVIYPGVYIDGVYVGGMTRDQAIQAVGQTEATGGGDFSITVQVGSDTWTIDSTMVPMTRNLSQVVDRAYALGRSNTTAIRGTRVTPFQERLNTATALAANPVGLSTEMTYDRNAVRNLVGAIASFVNRDPVNASVASFDFNTRSFTFNSDEAGAHIDAEAVYNQIIQCLDGGTRYATVSVEPQVLLAQVTKAELMNTFRMISSYTTSTTSNDNRNTNVRLSAEAINGVTVNPGETFSFNRTTGQRTAEKGYREAAAISGGQSVPEIGGGVCQTSSTLFNAVARANLEIVDRSPHAWPSDYVEKGMDATVNWPDLDFKFKNNTDWPIFIVAHYANRKITVELYGMSLGDGVSIDLQSIVTYTKEPPSDPIYVQNTSLPSGTQQTTIKARTGYTVETWQIWYQNGQEVSRNLLCKSNYRMYQQTIEWN